MTAKSDKPDLGLQFGLVCLFVGFGFFMLLGFRWLNSVDINRFEKPQFHWTHVETDGWMYAPADINVWARNVSRREPIGTLDKTDDGAWRAFWRLKPCGSGEYLNRELAEKCVENAAQNDGFFGYWFRPKEEATLPKVPSKGEQPCPSPHEVRREDGVCVCEPGYATNAQATACVPISQQ